MLEVVMYTDGACSGNPGPGGWGAVIMYGAHTMEASGGKSMTTNNEMEFAAVLGGLLALTKLTYEYTVEIYTDSTLVIGAMARGWKLKTPHLIKLRDMVAATAEEQGQILEFHWVKGHSGNPINDRADQLAKAAIIREETHD